MSEYAACSFQDIPDKSLETMRILLGNLYSHMRTGHLKARVSLNEADAMKLTLDIIANEQAARAFDHECYQPSGENGEDRAKMC